MSRSHKSDPPKEPRTLTRGIRFTETEWRLIRERARRFGLGGAAYLRQLGLGQVPKTRPRRVPGEDLVYHLGRIGNNLNQIARIANLSRKVSLERELRELLEELREIVRGLLR